MFRRPRALADKPAKPPRQHAPLSDGALMHVLGGYIGETEKNLPRPS